MAKVCTNCMMVFDHEFDLPYCPVEKCYGELYEIDDLFVYPYTKLIKNGYYPKHCCSGHVRDHIQDMSMCTNFGCYINIDALSDYDIDADKFGKIFS